MRASQNAVDMIKRFEGCRLESYQDQGGVWTIGWGSTGPGIRENLKISQRVADGMLLGDIGWLSQDLAQLVGISLNQNAFDACMSLVYNIGLGAFKSSTMLKLILQHKLSLAAEEFPKWDHVQGVVSPGLLARRLAEQTLFQTES